MPPSPSLLARPGVKAALAHAGRTLSSRRVVGSAADGGVRATLGGDGRVIDLTVAPHIGKEHWLLSAHITAAINNAHQALREETRAEVRNELPPNVDVSMILRAS